MARRRLLLLRVFVQHPPEALPIGSAQRLQMAGKFLIRQLQRLPDGAIHPLRGGDQVRNRYPVLGARQRIAVEILPELPLLVSVEIVQQSLQVAVCKVDNVPQSLGCAGRRAKGDHTGIIGIRPRPVGSIDNTGRPSAPVSSEIHSMSGKTGKRATGRKPVSVRRRNAMTAGATGREKAQRVRRGGSGGNSGGAVRKGGAGGAGGA